MDHTAARKRPSSARFHKYLPYLAHQVGYQRFRETSGAQVLWCSSIVVLCIDTSRSKWNFWTSHPWTRPTDMSSKLSRSSNKRRDNLGLGTPHKKIQEREAPTHRTKDRENMGSIKTTSIRRKQRRTPERQRKIPGSGATSIRALGITLLITAQSSHWWPK
jgi:hypothetical protein